MNTPTESTHTRITTDSAFDRIAASYALRRMLLNAGFKKPFLSMPFSGEYLSEDGSVRVECEMHGDVYIPGCSLDMDDDAWHEISVTADANAASNLGTRVQEWASQYKTN